MGELKQDPDDAHQVMSTASALNASLCRYEVIKASGKGLFSSVVTAADKLQQEADGNPLVAIKVIRANDTMYKAGKLELSILNKLAEEDPDNRRHVIRLLRNFEYRNHLCLVRAEAIFVLRQMRLPRDMHGYRLIMPELSQCAGFWAHGNESTRAYWKSWCGAGHPDRRSWPACIANAGRTEASAQHKRAACRHQA